MKVTIMRGISGAGKSTWARENRSEALVASMDDLRTDENGNYRYVRGKLPELRRLCFDRFVGCLESGRDVVVDNMSVSPRFLRYVEEALGRGAEVEVVTILVDPAVASERTAHGVPLEVNQQQHERLLRALDEVPLPSEVAHTIIDHRG